MSTKTIALETRVYTRLAAAKRQGESFSKAIDRLLTELATAHTGSDILRRLATIPALSAADSEAFLDAIAENRELERWDAHDLR